MKLGNVTIKDRSLRKQKKKNHYTWKSATPKAKLLKLKAKDT